MASSLSHEARVLALLQRTELLPTRPSLPLIPRIRRRLSGGRDPHFLEFVSLYARDAKDKIDVEYYDLAAKEAMALIPLVPAGAKSFLDIGCGLAGVDLFLYKHFLFEHIYLLDKSGLDENIRYSFRPTASVYNSLLVAREFLLSNEVPNGAVSVIESPPDGVIPLAPASVDVVVSTLAWGFHFPIQTYLESVASLLAPGGVLILDVRRETDGIALLRDFFYVDVCDETENRTRVRASLR